MTTTEKSDAQAFWDFLKWVEGNGYMCNVTKFQQYRPKTGGGYSAHNVTELQVMIIANHKTNYPHRSFHAKSDDGMMDCFNQLWTQMEKYV